MRNVRRNSDSSSRTGNWTALAFAAAITASPLLSLLMPKDDSASKWKDSIDPKPLEHKSISILPWHKNISPDKYAPEMEGWKVRRGETIFKIADQCKVPADLIMSINNRFGQKADQIYPGEMLELPAVQGVRLDKNGWHGKVFSLNLESKSDWIYMCQSLVCNQEASSPVRVAISCSLQYMPSNLRRSFIAKIGETLRELCKDEISIDGRSLEIVRWPDSSPLNIKKMQQLAAAYCWALEAASKQRYSSCFPKEDAIREVNPHPFRIPAKALIASTESLRAIGFIQQEKYDPKSYGLPDGIISISSLSGYPIVDISKVRAGKQHYGLINFGTGDHNGVFSNAVVLMEAGKKNNVPMLYIESYDAEDMLAQSKAVAGFVGRKPDSIALGGHGGHSEDECSLQVGYSSWLRNSSGNVYCLSSKNDSTAISNLATKSIVIVSCSSGVKLPKGTNFVDAIAKSAASSVNNGTIYIYGMKNPSNLFRAKILSDGSLVPTMGEEGQDVYSRTVTKKINRSRHLSL